MNLIRKLAVYLTILIIAALVGSLYGIIHDQISYTLSSEYFTELKFRQTRIPWAYENPRLGAAYVGIFATWWMGVLVYSVLGLIGFIFNQPKLMAIYLLKSMPIVVTCAFATGLIGLVYGFISVDEQVVIDNINYIPSNISNPVQFLRVAYMHTASYIGGIVSLIAGAIYLIVSNKRNK